MNLFLTLDYELFFGNPVGSVEKCIIEPTQRLLAISKKHGVGMTYFVDIGYLLKLEAYKSEFSNLQKDYLLIVNQLKQIIAEGSDVQLHIHPHWEDCTYSNSGWNMITDAHYKLSDYTKPEIEALVLRYKEALERIIGREVKAFRAGGWCLQPFNVVKETFLKAGVKYDSTVFQGGKFESAHYFFDFTNAPDKGRYNFSNVLTQEDKNGEFTEIPIGGMKYHPLFYWQLYGWGRVRPSRHKMIGDGNFIAQPGRKKNHLTHSSWNHISMDGYFAKKMHWATKKFAKKGRTDLVIIGHPKGLTEFAFEKIEKYIRLNKSKHNFSTFNQL